MTFSDLASVGSFVSSLAVRGSLIYLALQVRQSEKNQRAMMNQGMAARVTSALGTMLQPEIQALRVRITAGDCEFSALDIDKLHILMRMFILSLQDSYFQRKIGLVDQSTLDSSIGALKAILALPVYQAIWKGGRESYSPEIAVFVDGLIEQLPRAEPVDLVGRLKADLAEVMRPPASE